MRVKTRFDQAKVRRKAAAGTVNSLGHAGALIRRIARNSIKKAPKDRGRDKQGRFTSGGTAPSSPGTPPHTRKGQLKRAILYAVVQTRQTVLIGPSAEIVADAGKAHEFGGRFRRERYPRRPFMGPALAKAKERLPKFWRGSVRG